MHGLNAMTCLLTSGSLYSLRHSLTQPFNYLSLSDLQDLAHATLAPVVYSRYVW